MDMKKMNDPMGLAVSEFYETGRAGKLSVLSPLFDEDEMPVSMLFRTLEQMPLIEQKAMEMARGRTLDVGAGAGCHALALQSMEIDVTAIDISPLLVETMTKRGVKRAVLCNFFDIREKYDTILMLMNGIGIVGTIDKMPSFFAHLDTVLTPNGQVLCDSSDLCYIFENESGVIEPPYPNRYYGELTYRMRYRNVTGPEFNWLYINPSTLTDIARKCGFRAEVVARGEHYDYLARITRL